MRATNRSNRNAEADKNRQSLKLAEQSFCVFEILCVKTLGEATKHGAKQIRCFGTLAAIHPKPGKVRRSTKLKRPRLLFARRLQSLIEQGLHLGVGCAAHEQRAGF